MNASGLTPMLPLMQPRMQRGGTLLGIIVGLVIGLAIALAVSLYMKRAEMPFVKRNQVSRPEPEKSGEKEAAAIAVPRDPNESLYSKPKPQEAKPSLADVVPGKSDEPAGTKSAENRNLGIDSGTDGKAPVLPRQPIDPANSDPLGKLVEKVAKAELPAVTKVPEGRSSASAAGPTALPNANGVITPADEGSRFLLQVGAFKQPEDAENMRAKLTMLGFDAKVSQRETDTGTLHRVRIGPLPTLELTNRARVKLAENSIESSIIKIK